MQLQLNQGPQDALLYDNSSSVFVNVGYKRTSNFQIEYKDVQPQSQPALGGQCTFIIPKAADLLGPVDLMCTLEAPKAPTMTEVSTFANFSEQDYIFVTKDGRKVKRSAVAAFVSVIVGFCSGPKPPYTGVTKLVTRCSSRLRLANLD